MEIKHNISEEMRKNGCPMGHCCDKCNLYAPAYKTVESGDVVQEWDCTFKIIALLQSETKNRVFGVQQSVESSRNESIKRQDKLLSHVMREDNAVVSRQ